MGEQSRLSNQGEELKSLFRDWIPKRKATVHTLRVLADKLNSHHNNVCKAQVSGSCAAIVGSVLVGVGFGLAFVTFGTSLIVSGVGGGIGALGGLTTAGSSIVEICIQKDTFDTAQKIIDEDRKATEAIENLWKEIKKEAKESTIEKSVKVGIAAASFIKNGGETAFKFGARIGATAASEGGEALFRSLGVAGRVAHIGGFVVSAVLLPLDIYTLVTNSMEIDASRKGKKGKEPKAVNKLRELANELAKDMPDETEFTRQIDDLILTANQPSTPMETV